MSFVESCKYLFLSIFKDISMDLCKLEEYPQFSRQVAELLYSEWSKEYRLFDNIHSIDELEQLIKTYKVFIARFQKEVIGVATISDSDWGVRPDLSPWLGNVCVKPAFRKIGVGQRLVQYVLRHVDTAIYLWTYSEDLVKFYENAGFRLLQYIDKHHHYQHIYVMYFKPRLN